MLSGSFQGIRGEIDRCFDFVRGSCEFFDLGFLALDEFLQFGVSVGGCPTSCACVWIALSGTTWRAFKISEWSGVNEGALVVDSKCRGYSVNGYSVVWDL